MSEGLGTFTHIISFSSLRTIICERHDHQMNTTKCGSRSSSLILSLLLTQVILLLYISFSHIYKEFVPPVFPEHLLGVKHVPGIKSKPSTCLWWQLLLRTCPKPYYSFCEATWICYMMVYIKGAHPSFKGPYNLKDIICDCCYWGGFGVCQVFPEDGIVSFLHLIAMLGGKITRLYPDTIFWEVHRLFGPMG